MSRLGGFGGLGSYYGLSDALLQQPSQSQRYESSDYDDRDSRLREIDQRRSEYDRSDSTDDYSQYRDFSSRRSTSRSDRYSPKPQHSYDTDRERQAGWSEPVSYPLGHVGQSRSADHVQDRGRNQNRNHNRNTSRPGDSRGHTNEGPGILGAKPGDRLVPDISSLSGLGGQGLTAQIAQQHQQLMAMVQTQSLLAAVQGQIKQGMAMLPNALGMAQGGLNHPRPMHPPRQMGQQRFMNQQRPMNQQRQMYQQRQMNRKRPGSQEWRDGAGAQKRDRLQGPQNRYQNRQQNRQNQQQQQGQKSSNERQKPRQTRWSAPETKETEKQSASEQDKTIESEKSMQQEEDVGYEEEDHEEEGGEDEEVEEQEEPAEESPAPEESVESSKVLNFAGEDVEALLTTLFDANRSKYICQDCKIICNKEHSFRLHLMGKRHVRTVIEKAGATFNSDQFKKFEGGTAPPALGEMAAKKEPEEAPAENASHEEGAAAVAAKQDDLDFVKYTFDTRKTAYKEGDAVTISSVTKARVRIVGFTSGRAMQGCEFVKAVAGFNCRLCKTFIRCGKDVTQHIQGKKHSRNYQVYLEKNPNYEKEQQNRNQELDDVLEQRDGQEVVLYEVTDEETNNKQRKRRSDSRNSSLSEVEVTKFVPASKEDEDNSPVNSEEEGDDDDEKGDATRENNDAPNLSLFEADEELEREIAIEDGVKLDDAVKEEGPSPDTTTKTEPAETAARSEEPAGAGNVLEQTPQPSPSTRRGRRGGARAGTVRGRGRGRGARRGRGGRQSAAAKREAAAKKEVAPEDDGTAEEDSLIAGFQVIDEIGDGEED